MDVFSIQRRLVNDYKSYVESVVTIRDQRIKTFVEREYEQGKYWPEALVQLNPAFERGAWIDELVRASSIDDSQATKRNKLLENWERFAANGSDRRPTLRELLDWATLEDLDAILRSELVWKEIGHHFESKRRLAEALGWLRDFRNPMAHSRGVSEGARTNGEEALRRFSEVVNAMA